MLLEQLTVIKEVGLGIAALVALFYLFKMVLTWYHKQAEKTLEIAVQTSDKILKLADDTIAKNTQALQKMQESLIKNMKSKDELAEAMDDQTSSFLTIHEKCKRNWDTQLQKIIDLGKKH